MKAMPQLCTPTCDEFPSLSPQDSPTENHVLHLQMATFTVGQIPIAIFQEEHHRTQLSTQLLTSQPCGCPFWPPQRPETHWPLIFLHFWWPGHQKNAKMSKFRKKTEAQRGFGPRLISGYVFFFRSNKDGIIDGIIPQNKKMDAPGRPHGLRSESDVAPRQASPRL